VRGRLANRRLDLEVTEAARETIAREGYDPVYGARPLKRYIQREIETRIGRALLSGDLHDGSTILVDADGGELTVRWVDRRRGARAASGGAGRRLSASPAPRPRSMLIRSALDDRERDDLARAYRRCGTGILGSCGRRSMRFIPRIRRMPPV
jgi:C-terminal, D2-small domain, of ClpB protein